MLVELGFFPFLGMVPGARDSDCASPSRAGGTSEVLEPFPPVFEPTNLEASFTLTGEHVPLSEEIGLGTEREFADPADQLLQRVEAFLNCRLGLILTPTKSIQTRVETAFKALHSVIDLICLIVQAGEARDNGR